MGKIENPVAYGPVDVSGADRWDDPADRLRHALDHDELVLYCQPILALEGPARFPMAEALIRLREEEKAMLPPGEFLPIFEHYGMLPELDRWVVRRVIAHFVIGSKIPRISINVSRQTLEDPAFPLAVAEALMTSGVPGSSLAFEIDEADIVERGKDALRLTRALKALGTAIIVDGFGREAVQPTMLRALGVDYIKIHGSIVRQMLTSDAAKARMDAMRRVGEVICLGAIAESVEDEAVLEGLRAAGIPYGQGFAIAMPEPLEIVG